MMSKDNKRTPTGDYPVGFAAPPEQHRYPKGKSGNPKGRPKGYAALQPEDIDKLLCSPVSVQQSGRAVKKMPQLEVELRKLAQKGLHDKDMKSIERLLKKFKQYGLLPEAPVDETGGVITLTVTERVPSRMATLLLLTYGEPPWSDEEIAAIQPKYEKSEAEYWATKKAALRSIAEGMGRGRK